MKNVLALDASSENISLYIKKDGREVYDYNRSFRFGASKLPGIIDKALADSAMKLNDFEAFFLGSGPGSFTGLRISFSIFKAFMLSLNKPVYPVGSFFSLAYSERNKAEKIAVIGDARRDLIYLASFRSKSGVLKKSGKERLIGMKELIKQKKDHFFVSYDLNLREKILALEPKIKFYDKAVYPKAKYLLAGTKVLGITCVRRVEKLKPLYLHPKTCQIKKI